MNRNWLDNLKSDLPASIVVFLVALPLCMGIAIASGVPVAAGLMTGIVGGIVVGLLAGSPLQVSGPAAGLTVVIYEIVQRDGLEVLGVAVLLGGTLQLVSGIFRLGQWFRAVSPAVIQGMLAGIGVLIFASQFHVMVDDNPKGSGIQNLVTIPQAIAKGVGIPEIGSAEQREFHTQALREVGELHRRQAALAETVAEQLPDHATPAERNAETPEQIDAEATALRELLPEQEAISDQLAAIVARLEKFEPQMARPEKARAVLEAAHAAQTHSRVAADELRAGDVQESLSGQEQAVASLGDVLGRMKSHNFAAIVGVLTIIVIVAWQLLVPKKLRLIPGPLIAVVAGTAFAYFATAPVLYVEVPNNLWDEVRLPTLAILSDIPWQAALTSALVIAVVASAETLLCATAVDQLHQGPRTNYDRELAAQGIGNMCCGLLGALPMTGVIVRSSANVQAGAKSRLSAVLHGLWLLVFVAFLAGMLRLIPTASLAAILVYTGFKLVNIKAVKGLAMHGWGEVVIYAATLTMIVVTDLLTGVITGVVLSALKLLYTFSHLYAKVTVEPDGKTAVLKLRGSATFLRLPKLAAQLECVPKNADLHVDFRQVSYVDHACFDLLMNWAKQHESLGGTLSINWDSLPAELNMRRAKANGDSPQPALSRNGDGTEKTTDEPLQTTPHH